MRYFAGLFDAEGYVSLVPTGHFRIGIEITHSPIIESLQSFLGGKIYEHKRNNKKRSWEWAIVTNTKEMFNFIEHILPFTVIKTPQLQRIKDYLELPRKMRKESRKEISHQLANLKIPLPLTKSHFDFSPSIIPDNSFYEWLAGFLDGDGNLCIYEYKGTSGNQIFNSWIGIFNTHGEAIHFVQQRINGSISQYKGCKYPVWKWVCRQKDSFNLCEKLLPFLVIKKEQCKLMIEYFRIKEFKTREQSYSFDDINKIREIICQIKHLNSL